MQVDDIEMGTVIDHVKAGRASKIMKVLGIGEDYGHRVAIVTNVPSKKMGTKDILKLEGKIVSQAEADGIALVSPGATINVIKSGKVERKIKAGLPKEARGYCRCPNPNCITNSEGAERIFYKGDGGYRCHYCERLFNAEELV